MILGCVSVPVLSVRLILQPPIWSLGNRRQPEAKLTQCDCCYNLCLQTHQDDAKYTCDISKNVPFLNDILWKTFQKVFLYCLKPLSDTIGGTVSIKFVTFNLTTTPPYWRGACETRQSLTSSFLPALLFYSSLFYYLHFYGNNWMQPSEYLRGDWLWVLPLHLYDSSHHFNYKDMQNRQNSQGGIMEAVWWRKEEAMTAEERIIHFSFCSVEYLS